MAEAVRTMLAAILVEQHRPLVLDRVELPEALAAGQVLVRIRYTGVCGSQVGEVDAVKGPDPHLPHLLGHEGAGLVVEVGLGVSRVRAGDHVVLHWRKAAGIEAPPPVYRWRGRPLNAGWVTTFNEYAVVSENRVTPIPHDFDLEAASLFGCPVTTGLGVIENDAKLLPGETVIVLGAGGVGLSVIQGAVLAEAAEIVVVDRSDEKLELAARLGATHTVLAGTDLENALRGVVGRQGADVVVENTGNRALIELAYSLAKPQGRAVLVGVPRLGEKASIDTLPLHFGKRLTGSHGGSSEPDRDIPRLVDLSRNGRLRLREMITERGTLADVGAALERLRDGRVTGRCVLEVNRE